jgi:O-antigen/teichoic acid export membrane protein
MKKKIYKKVKSIFFKSEFNSNVLTLMTGTTIAQAIPIAITPILTRLYTPEDFGTYALFIAITSIFANVISGRYELAIMLPQKNEEVINIFALGLIITFINSLALLMFLLIFNDYLANSLDNEEVSKWLFFIPISIFLSGLWNLIRYLNIKKKQYKHLANLTIVKSIVLALVQISIGLVKSGPTGLVSGHIISQLFANLKLFLYIIKNKVLISGKKIIYLAKKYQKFPKYGVPAAFSDTAAQQLPLILLPKLFGLDTSGFFFLTSKVIAVPSASIGGAIGEVFFQELSKKKNMKLKCWPLFINTVKKLFFIGLPFAFFIALFGPYLFQFVFGEQWKISGVIARYLAITFLFTFVVSTVSSVFLFSGDIKKGAFWAHLYLITRLCIFGFSVWTGLKFFEFLLLFIIHEILLYLIYFYLIVKAVKKIDEKIE